MAKLSKAQQEVVDKMREGWELRDSLFAGHYLAKGEEVIKVNKNTTSALLRRELLLDVTPVMSGLITYKLIEKNRH